MKKYLLMFLAGVFFVVPSYAQECAIEDVLEEGGFSEHSEMITKFKETFGESVEEFSDVDIESDLLINKAGSDVLDVVRPEVSAEEEAVASLAKDALESMRMFSTADVIGFIVATGIGIYEAVDTFKDPHATTVKKYESVANIFSPGPMMVVNAFTRIAEAIKRENKIRGANHTTEMINNHKRQRPWEDTFDLLTYQDKLEAHVRTPKIVEMIEKDLALVQERYLKDLKVSMRTVQTAIDEYYTKKAFEDIDLFSDIEAWMKYVAQEQAFPTIKPLPTMKVFDLKDPDHNSFYMASTCTNQSPSSAMKCIDDTFRYFAYIGDHLDWSSEANTQFGQLLRAHMSTTAHAMATLKIGAIYNYKKTAQAHLKEISTLFKKEMLGVLVTAIGQSVEDVAKAGYFNANGYDSQGRDLTKACWDTNSIQIPSWAYNQMNGTNYPPGGFVTEVFEEYDSDCETAIYYPKDDGALAKARQEIEALKSLVVNLADSYAEHPIEADDLARVRGYFASPANDGLGEAFAEILFKKYDMHRTPEGWYKSYHALYYPRLQRETGMDIPPSDDEIAAYLAERDARLEAEGLPWTPVTIEELHDEDTPDWTPYRRASKRKRAVLLQRIIDRFIRDFDDFHYNLNINPTPNYVFWEEFYAPSAQEYDPDYQPNVGTTFLGYDAHNRENMPLFELLKLSPYLVNGRPYGLMPEREQSNEYWKYVGVHSYDNPTPYLTIPDEDY
ncbi:MAG: hypothetical protein KZQ81_07155 [Candidatus Thiodiazotropha sp. (ex Rostrolucina anterorostrata)]|nr:hypothetical protein [Candidatus Thiodiazotropha sp. (ex Rostrolucina anterorostrata)]